MHRIWPVEQSGALDAEALEELYSYPDRDWLTVNFVSSADGAVELHGRAVDLSNQPDQRVLRLGSDLADALLVGATTAAVEKFRGQHPDERTARRRLRHGLAAAAPTAVVTTGRSLPADAPVITEALVPTFVVTSEAAPADAREAWRGAGATVLTCGAKEVDLRLAVERLREHGLRHIDCEGGSRLFGSLVAAGLVDELRLTLSPILVSGPAGRISSGELPVPTDLELASVVAEGDTLLMRYLAGRPKADSGA